MVVVVIPVLVIRRLTAHVLVTVVTAVIRGAVSRSDFGVTIVALLSSRLRAVTLDNPTFVEVILFLLLWLWLWRWRWLRLLCFHERLALVPFLALVVIPPIPAFLSNDNGLRSCFPDDDGRVTRTILSDDDWSWLWWSVIVGFFNVPVHFVGVVSPVIVVVMVMRR